MHIATLAPDRDRCGISDYSRNLYSALSELESIHITKRLQPPADPVSGIIAGRAVRAGQFKAIGDELSAPPTQIVHIQHEFSLFGGAAPHKNTAAYLYNSIRLPIVLTVHEIIQETGNILRRTALH